MLSSSFIRIRWRAATACLALFLSCLLFHLDVGQCAEVSLQPVSHGTWPDKVRGSLRSIKLAGQFAFVAAQAGGLQILDVSDPTQPVFKGGYESGGSISDVDVAWPYAFVTDSVSGLVVLDVSDPTRPRRLRRPRVVGQGGDRVTVAGYLAFVRIPSVGLDIVDAFDPTNLFKVARYPATPESVKVVDNLAYLANGPGGIVVLDMFDPTNPQQVGQNLQVRNAKGMEIAGGYLYVADDTNGLQILHMASPTELNRVGGYRVGTGNSHPAARVEVDGNLAYVANRGSGLHVYDVSNPTNPVPLFIEGAISNNEDLEVRYPYVFMADSVRGLRVFTVTNSTSPALVGTYSYLGVTLRVQAVGRHAYLSDERGGFQVIDVSNPVLPFRVGGYAATLSTRGVSIVGGRAYVGAIPLNVTNQVAGAWSLTVLDVQQPTEPALLGSYTTISAVENLQVIGSLAYLAVAPYGFWILDVSAPTNIVRRSVYGSTGILGLYVTNNLAYVIEGAWLRILNVSNPDAPVLVGSGGPLAGFFGRVHVAGAHAYITSNTRGLHIFNVSNPANPVRVAQFTAFTNIYAVQVVGTRAFLAASTDGLVVLDVSNPTNPVITARYETKGDARDVYVDGHRIFLADYDNGLSVVLTVPNQQFTFRINGEPGTALTVQSATSLTRPISWIDRLTTNLPADPFFFTDAEVGGPSKFYRTKQP